MLTDWEKVLEVYRAQRDWEAERFPESWRHDLYKGRVYRLEALLSVSAHAWTGAELSWMQCRGAVGEEFWYKKLGRGRK